MIGRSSILWLNLALAPCALAQLPPMDRAEILGQLAQGQERVKKLVLQALLVSAEPTM